MAETTCEVCGKAPAKRDDILCVDCSRAYRILLELLDEYPGLGADDLERVRDIFEWRLRKSKTETVPNVEKIEK